MSINVSVLTSPEGAISVLRSEGGIRFKQICFATSLDEIAFRPFPSNFSSAFVVPAQTRANRNMTISSAIMSSSAITDSSKEGLRDGMSFCTSSVKLPLKSKNLQPSLRQMQSKRTTPTSYSRELVRLSILSPACKFGKSQLLGGCGNADSS